jgi:hypothetical protein
LSIFGDHLVSTSYYIVYFGAKRTVEVDPEVERKVVRLRPVVVGSVIELLQVSQ